MRLARVGQVAMLIANLLALASTCEPWCSKWTCNQPSFCGSCGACASPPPPPPMAPVRFANRNPFATPRGWFVNPVLREKMMQSVGLAESEAERTALRHMASAPTAFWVDRKAKIRGTTVDTMEGLLLNNSRGAKQLVVLILYNLPNRDCNAMASNGEICCDGHGGAGSPCSHTSGGSCEAGLREYREEYIQPISEVLVRFHSSMPLILVLEPDSMGNVVTNTGSGGCTDATLAAYRSGIRFAAEKLAAAAPTAALYVDAGHGGWLGFEKNAQRFAEVVHDMDIARFVRGFSTNVANYQPLGLSAACPRDAFETAGVSDAQQGGSMGGLAHWCNEGRSFKAGGVVVYSASKLGCCAEDPCGLVAQGNGGPTELSYAQTLQRHFMRRMNWQPRFVIDTGRNGNKEQRSKCASWCNVRGAGAGHVPSMNTGLPGVVDAFMWLKTPGESDGCTRLLPSGGRCARFDPACEGDDAIGGRPYEPRAPEAGDWFAFQARALARNSNLHLEAEGALDPLWGVPNQPPRTPSPSPPSPPPQIPPCPLRAPPPPPPPPALRPAAIARAKAKADAKAAQAAMAQERNAARSGGDGSSELAGDEGQGADEALVSDGGGEETQESARKDGGVSLPDDSPPPSPLAVPNAPPPSAAQPPVLFSVLYYLGAVLLCASLVGAVALHAPSDELRLRASAVLASLGLHSSWVGPHALSLASSPCRKTPPTARVQPSSSRVGKPGKRHEERAEERVSLISEEEPAATLPATGRACSAAAREARMPPVQSAEELSEELIVNQAAQRDGSRGGRASGGGRSMQGGERWRDDRILQAGYTIGKKAAEPKPVVPEVSGAALRPGMKPAAHCGLTMD